MENWHYRMMSVEKDAKLSWFWHEEKVWADNSVRKAKEKKMLWIATVDANH